MNRNRRNLALWTSGVLFVLTIIVIGSVNLWLPRKLETMAGDRLKARELAGKWDGVGWLPIRGLKIDNLEIRQTSGDRALVCRIPHVTVRMPLWRALSRNTRVSDWHVGNEKVIVGDADGEITLEQVSARWEMRAGKIIVHRFKARHQGLVTDLEGEILLKEARSDPKPFSLKLRGLRGSLLTLDFSGKGKPFKTTGTFHVDVRGNIPVWRSKLNGAGKDVVWKSVKLERATAEADLSSEESIIRTDIRLPGGSASAVINKNGWKETPFLFEGTIEDRAGRRNEFNGSFVRRTLEIERLAGDADLFQMARDVPQLADGLPEGMKFLRFPKIDARNIRWHPERDWSIASLEVRGDGAAIITAEKKEIEISSISATMSYDGNFWQIADSGMKAFGGDFSIKGSYKKGSLNRADIRASGIKLAEIKRVTGKSVRKGTRGILSVSYQGSVRLKDRNFNGSGSMRMDDAPVFEVPLLDEVYELFASIVPGATSTGEGRFDARFSSKSHLVEVKRFSATGGSLSVTANGTVDLKKETVAGFARGNLSGAPGLLTRPIGKLLEMEVSGRWDNIQVKPVGPAHSISEAAAGSAGKIIDELEKIGEKLRGEVPEKED
jgi:hypothetical protein